MTGRFTRLAELSVHGRTCRKARSFWSAAEIGLAAWDDRFALDTEPLTAGAQDPHPGAAGGDRHDECPARAEQVLAIVEYEQQPPLAKIGDQSVLDRGARPVAHAHRVCEGGRDELLAVEIRQLHHPHASG
jgi:hypothetical protein